jgi:hypothetical protein
MDRLMFTVSLDEKRYVNPCSPYHLHLHSATVSAGQPIPSDARWKMR